MSELKRPQAVIFDMDGLLINSEPIWRVSETRVFAKLGVHLNEADLISTMGWRIDRVVRHWRAERGWQGPSDEHVAARIVEGVADGMRADGQLLPGVHDAFEATREAGLPLALASSSPMLLIETLIDHFALRSHFRSVHSAETEQWGKPHPAVFLTAAKSLGVAPQAAWILEDSLTGVIAAKAATAACIAVPQGPDRQDPRFVVADAILESLVDFPTLLADAL